jgi:DNA modification methylase
LWLDEVLTFKQMIVWDKGPMGMGWHYRRSYETVLVAHKGKKCRWYDETNKVENIIRHIGKIIPSASQHPTQKPEELASHFIRLHTQPGDVVLDPFCGSGSTLEACEREGRRWIGIDIDQHWCEVAYKRTRQQGLFTAEDFSALQPQHPAPQQDGEHPQADS